MYNWLELLAFVSILLVIIVFIYKLISEKTELREPYINGHHLYPWLDHIPKHCCRDYATFDYVSDEDAHHQLR